MFFKFSVLVALLPFVACLTVNTPENLSSGGTTTISWSTSSGDPSVFSFELLNEVFHNSFAIANNVQASAGSVTLQLPAVPPGDGYTLEAVNITNINDVFATSGGFSIAAASTTIASSTSAPASSASSAASASGTGSAAATSAASSSSFGRTVAASSTPSGSGSGSASSSAASSSTSPTSFNAATHMKALSAGSVGAMVAGAVVGAAVFAL